MKTDFSSVEKCGSYITYDISWSKRSSFMIVTHATNRNAVLGFAGDIHASLEDDSISLITGDTRVCGNLRIGKKSTNQLRLGQIGFCIPKTLVLDFTFFDNFKRDSTINLKEVYQQHIAGKLGSSLAIRCSSNLEDSEKFSFAGTFDTYLDVPNDFSAVEEKILQSYNKFSSIDSASAGEQLRDLREYDLKLGIMIQSLVKPKFSGFLFTSDPTDPPNNWSIIEYWQGKREQSEGYSITLNNESAKRIPTNRDKSDVPLPAETQDKLALAARELNNHFGFPQDAEFVVSDEDQQLYLVQSRPITAFSYSPTKVADVEKDRLSEIRKQNIQSYKRAPILSSTNISELFVRAVPLGYSIFKYGFAGTHEKKGGISIGRSRLGYAELTFEDQVNFFYTVADQARTNIIVDALTFRLQSISRDDYLTSFVSHYLRQIEVNPAAALYPEDGLYLQDVDSARWHDIAGEQGDELRKQYSDFLNHVVEHHAPQEHEKASAFFDENEGFYRSHLNRELYAASDDQLKEEIIEILEYLRTSFCPQYVVFARIAYLCTHVAKQKLKNLMGSETTSPVEHILNQILMRVDIRPEHNGPDYAVYERLMKTRRITVPAFLDKFQHLGSLDINQPRLGEYSIEDLHTIFSEDKHYDHGDGRLSLNDYAIVNNEIEISKLGLEEHTEFWSVCRYAGQFMRLRERAKSELLKVLYVLKRVVSELGRIYRLGDLVYFLEYKELLNLSRSERENKRLLALQRRSYFESCRQHRIRDVLLDFDVSPFEQQQQDGHQDIGDHYKSVKGQSVFHGLAEGVCLTAQSNDEYLRKLAAYKAANRGPIVGVFKGVELSYFNLGALAGFTTERGGYLSHAATIAREFRIPYITGINVDEFNDGDYVILDTENEQIIYRR